MKPRLPFLAALLALLASPCFADWRVLKDSTGNVVEVAVDFTVEEFKITDAGAASFNATARIDDEEIIPGEEINHDILESKSTDFRKWGER